MKKMETSVPDGKLTDEQLGRLHRKFEEIVQKIDEGVIPFQDAVDVMQKIIIDGQSSLHLGVLKKIYEIKLAHLIDCDAQPFVPSEFTLVEHRLGGQYLFDPAKFLRFMPELPRGEVVITGNDLVKALKDKPIFNANVLDYLLDHQYLIPDSWKNESVFFLGTIYSFHGQLCIRCLIWNNSKWDWDCRFLSSGFNFSQHGFNLIVLAS